jgi:sugar phosphate isomerase/epimerase
MFQDLQALRAEQIAIVHLDDVPYDRPFSEMADGDRVYPGDGNIPVDALFHVLEEIGYAGVVSLELFSEELWRQDPFAVARTGFRKSERWLQA